MANSQLRTGALKKKLLIRSPNFTSNWLFPVKDVVIGKPGTTQPPHGIEDRGVSKPDKPPDSKKPGSRPNFGSGGGGGGSGEEPPPPEMSSPEGLPLIPEPQEGASGGEFIW